MKEKFFSSLWGAAGMVVLWVVSTTLSNQQAIALQANQIQQQADYDMKVETKIDKVLSNQTNILAETNSVKGKIEIVHGKVTSLDDKQKRITLSVAKMEHETACGLRYSHKEDKAFNECVKAFNPNILN